MFFIVFRGSIIWVPLESVRRYDSQVFEKYARSKKTFIALDKIYETAHGKTNNKTCATSEDSDQTARLRSLIRVFADRMCFLLSPGYPKRDKQESLLYWVGVQADLCWSHRSYCRFCRALTQCLLDYLKVVLFMGWS